MAKGGGLSIDLDPIGFFPHQPIVLNSFPEDNINNHNNFKCKLTAMDATLNNRSPPSTIQFPVNLNCSNLHDSPPPSDGKRTVIDEMDFFAEKDHDNKAAPSTDHADKKDDLDRPTTLEFNVNVREYIVLFNTIILYCITVFFFLKQLKGLNWFCFCFIDWFESSYYEH